MRTHMGNMLRWLPPIAFVGLIGGVLWWAARPSPGLSEIPALLATGRHAEAEKRLLSYLDAHPDDQAARLALARSAIERDEPKPELALAMLADLPAASEANPRLAAELKALEGQARFHLRHYERAEALWREALRLNPAIPEVGWALLNLYALQGRDQEARALGLVLFRSEPDPHDRVQLLLQLIRHDAHPIAASSVIHQLEQVVRANPSDLESALALGRALARDSRHEEGLRLLSQAVAEHPDNLDARETCLMALADASRLEALEKALASLPPAMAESPRFDEARGWLAAQKQDWDAAARTNLRAWRARPTDAAIAYRLQTALRQGGRAEGVGIDDLAARLAAVSTARGRITALYDRIDAIPDLGRGPHAALYLEAADTLEALGRSEEAAAWRQVASETHSRP